MFVKVNNDLYWHIMYINMFNHQQNEMELLDFDCDICIDDNQSIIRCKINKINY